MVRNLNLADFSELSPAERILLVEEIWDSIASTPGAVPVSDAQQRELDARLAAHEREPRGGVRTDW
jgi:putative addiction module component (TIGR02574 family)